MVNVWALVASSLASPDDQGEDWYGWITNQLGHAMLGVTLGGVVLLLGGGWFWAVTINTILTGAVETWDLLQSPRDDWPSFRDSLQDLSFWLLGALLAIALFNNSIAMFLTVVALSLALAITGIWPRAIRAYKAANGV
jgi:hypothetical protein